MRISQVAEKIKKEENFLCVGIDPDPKKIPDSLPKNYSGILEFNRRIIHATKEHCVAFKLNFAFFEAMGSDGWRLLEETRKLLPSSHYLIADAKRGDIGNTASQYAEAIFGRLDFDAVTLSPYMGKDVATPFYKYDDKDVILLALTSNEGGAEMQLPKLESGEYYFEYVLKKSCQWGSANNTMYVVGATKPEFFQNIRKIVPDHFLLVPGVGAQGGNLEAVFKNGGNSQVGLLVNSSRGIIFAGSDEKFDEAAAVAAKHLGEEMRALMNARS